MNGLRKAVGRIVNPSYLQAGLTDTLAALRRGQGLPAGKKVLIILDQFEQWLHARREEQNTELVQALRQCDGARVQCIVMVRDDFWLAVSRFLRELEIRLVEGHNSALVDLFDLAHAYKVLAAFGRAFGKLPEFSGNLGKEQKQFLDQAVGGLAQEGKVVCVRLALFAEMMKGKEWTPATLKAAGGAEGVGAAFLEETFSAQTAPPERRYHQKAARAVLKALLPEAGADIKGHMRSRHELLEASGHGNRPKEFDDLIRILDSEVRLITPTDPEGDSVSRDAKSSERSAEATDSSALRSERLPGAPGLTGFYQLTHDYLVPSLRDWLTRKQKETRHGRAELLLADRAAVWNARQENRQLPSLLQWFGIRCLTKKKAWTPPQRKMMRRATRHQALRGFAVAVLLALIGVGSYEIHGRLQARLLRDRLLEATTADVPGIVYDMAPYRARLNPLLKDAQAQEKTDARKQLHLSLALLPADPGQVEYLRGRLLSAEPAEFLVIREQLAAHAPELSERLWTFVEDPENDPDQRFHATCALAKFDAGNPRWEKAAGNAAEQLVRQKPFVVSQWANALQPVARWLLPPLEGLLADDRRAESEVGLIAGIYEKYASVAPDALTRLEERLAARPKADAEEPAKVTLANKQTRIGVALVAMGRAAQVWPLLKHSPDPTLRSYLVNRLGPLGANANDIVRRLVEEPDVSIRRALILSLGEFGEGAFSTEERAALIAKFKDIYGADDDAGLHAATEWLLRQWKEEDWLTRTNEQWAQDKRARETKLKHIQQELASRAASAAGLGAPGRWYVNGQGQTMVVIPGPVEFDMGSPAAASGAENLHRKRIKRTFAIAAKPVTVLDFQQFRKDHLYLKERSPDLRCPVHQTDWYAGAAFCNWLSEREKIPGEQWCYETDKTGKVLKLKENNLSLTGYRLPTEAEWEFACRAGANTTRFYGEATKLLPKYGWFSANSLGRSWPVASLKPNDLGLFDMHGNVWNWCQDEYRKYPEAKANSPIDDVEGILTIDGTKNRVLRGGSYFDGASDARSACRVPYRPVIGLQFFGIRPARTFR